MPREAGSCMRCGKTATITQDAHLGVMVWRCGCGTKLFTPDRYRYVEALRKKGRKVRVP